jgi:hypothetical protein
MIIIWKRLGWLVPIIGLLGMISIELIVDAIFGGDYYKENILYQNIAVIFAGGLIFIVGKYLNHSDRLVIRCKHTRQVLEVKDKHEFFFIPFEWCGVLISILFLLAINNNAI